MKMVEKLLRKQSKLVIGLMSGTSADGIDAALVRIRGNGIGTKLHVAAFGMYPYPIGFKRLLLKNSNPTTARLDDIARLNFLVGELFADAAKAICKKAKVSLSDVDLIGSHGQTIQHLPNKKTMFGKEIRATMQIGEPAVIAQRTGVTTVADFRVADVAAGGTGAPLVPYADFLLFRSPKKNRALLNIGGIANITVLPANCSVEDVFAFDTGPGNMVVDALMEHFFKKPFDINGAVATKGQIIPKLLNWMLAHPYIQKKPPKSTGREAFGDKFVREILSRSKGQSKEDVIASAAMFTVLCVVASNARFIQTRIKLDELIVSGGGAHNRFIMNELKRFLPEVEVYPIDELGYSSDAKEAVAFALMANETIAGNPSNIISATGAKKRVVLGKVCFG